MDLADVHCPSIPRPIFHFHLTATIRANKIVSSTTAELMRSRGRHEGRRGARARGEARSFAAAHVEFDEHTYQDISYTIHHTRDETEAIEAVRPICPTDSKLIRGHHIVALEM